MLLFLVSIIALLIGLIKPNLVIRWGKKRKRNRKKVFAFYGSGIVLFFILFALTGSTVYSTDVFKTENQTIEIVKEESIKHFNSLKNLLEEKYDDILKGKVLGFQNRELLDKIEVHYIDVGQGDSILIKQGNNSMLIDAGENHYGEAVVDYIRGNEIDTLDYVIGTHPHSDHIGGLDDVINSFNIGKIIMPKVTHTTKTFEDVIMAIKNKEMKITTPIVGDVYKLGDAKFTILGPNKDNYNNLNDYSVLIKLEYGNNHFVFTGDAEMEAETEVTENGLDIKADVLKVSHHGSNTSTTEIFLNKVDPDFAVITVGAENRYGHPDNEVLNRLEERNIKIYRSDDHGNILAIGDGKNIKFKTQNSLNKELRLEEILNLGIKNIKKLINKLEIKSEKYLLDLQ